MARADLSVPVQLALRDGLLDGNTSFFDYGCGRGDDVARLGGIVREAHGWDPFHFPDERKRRAQVVNLGFVLNVIPESVERKEVLRRAWGLTSRTLVVAARLEGEARGLKGDTEADGIRTSHDTFQKFYSHRELQGFIAETLECQPLAAGAGVFYVFRRQEDRQRVIAGRFRGRLALPPVEVRRELFEAHRDVLLPLMEFFASRGRLPREQELWSGVKPIVEELGSIRRAWQIVLSATDRKRWSDLELERSRDLVLGLAMERFDGPRPRFTALDSTRQADIRAHFGSYTEAQRAGDHLLMAAGNMSLVDGALRVSRLGKRTPSALYVHRSALHRLHHVLRAYEGCARVLAGDDEHFNLVKLRSDRPAVSYLEYPAFDDEAHPALHRSISVDLRSLDVELRDFSQSPNPPVLHRKELFVDDGYPNRGTFEELTRAEVDAGLLDETDTIGRRQGWEECLLRHGYMVQGHTLVARADGSSIG